MPKPRHYRNYSDEDKASCVAMIDEVNGNVRAAARKAGIPHKTLDHWRKQTAGMSPECVKMTHAKKLDLADLWENHARQALGYAVDRVGDPEVSYADTVRGAAIAVDKMRLLREQATTITHDVRTQEEADQRILVILQRGLARLQGEADPQIQQAEVIDAESREIEGDPQG